MGVVSTIQITAQVAICYIWHCHRHKGMVYYKMDNRESWKLELGVSAAVTFVRE